MSLDFSGYSDGQLAVFVLSGQRDAFAVLMRRHDEAIYRLIRSYVGDRQEALDISQECFVSAFLALARFDCERPFRVWLSRIALNKCRDWARRRAVRRFLTFSISLSEEIDTVADQGPSVEEAVASRQLFDHVAHAVADLPATLKEPLILRTIEGFSQAETATLLGITEKAVETRVRRARARLLETLEKS